jgi:hypothetical protein
VLRWTPAHPPPARPVRHAGTLTLRLPPGYHLLDEVLARIRTLTAEFAAPSPTVDHIVDEITRARRPFSNTL